jgi:hypothetical protein
VLEQVIAMWRVEFDTIETKAQEEDNGTD